MNANEFNYAQCSVQVKSICAMFYCVDGLCESLYEEKKLAPKENSKIFCFFYLLFISYIDIDSKKHAKKQTFFVNTTLIGHMCFSRTSNASKRIYQTIFSAHSSIHRTVHEYKQPCRVCSSKTIFSRTQP